MYCPVCDHEDTRVVDSRISTDGNLVRRRRECDKCGYRFSTAEEVTLLDISIVKRDGQREAYNREKLIKGVKKSLEKRPYTDVAFRQLIHAIERDIQRERADQITSETLGSFVMMHLKEFDQVAYIRFASVYRQFEDVDTFRKELDELRELQAKKKKDAS